MLEKVLPKAERNIFNCLKSTEAVLEFLSNYYGITMETQTEEWLGGGIFGCAEEEENNGSYFQEKVKNNVDDVALEDSFNLFGL